MATFSIVIEDENASLSCDNDFIFLHGQDHAVDIAREEPVVVRWVKVDSVNDLETAILCIVCHKLDRATCLSKCNDVGLLVDSAE